ncbi:hypothetical protein PCC8801_0668 [Rippkaea orientalis PCC 8801]|uniref:Uncharacterized protein n=1 Tax=Rippkaea orientalis (strain PCC 8801 / RF-1) TaxID=41431 RepID=B7JXJ6_RIPO1|nr:hypothetical protein [Rippkaea orientalis]ACK64753.1 hypothetical protein PCC8801_0668 [Rippkaea orientalis PCC 8801]
MKIVTNPFYKSDKIKQFYCISSVKSSASNILETQKRRNIVGNSSNFKELGKYQSNQGKINSSMKRVPDLFPNSIIISEDFDEPLPDEFWLGEE